MDPDDPITVAVALKLGWSTQMAAVPGYQTPYRVWRRDDLTRPLPPYSTSIEAAWELVEFVKDDISIDRVGPLWRARFLRRWNEWSEAATAPLAICQAFLKLP